MRLTGLKAPTDSKMHDFVNTLDLGPGHVCNNCVGPDTTNPRVWLGGGGGGGGGGGFFLACKDFGRMFEHSFPACAFVSFFCFKWR